MLMDVVSAIATDIGIAFPIYADDTCIYVCGASSSDIAKLSDTTKKRVKDLGYSVSAITSNKSYKVGRYSVRVR
ncbi:MAG: hypothetical protein NC131_16995 [Roseburia sp.]|nr:hypothetical protein [Roseburia sp.]